MSNQVDGASVTFACEQGRVRLSFLTEGLVRVHMAPKGQEFPKDDLHLDQNGPYAVVKYDWPGVKPKLGEGFDSDEEGLVYRIEAGRLLVKVRKSPVKLIFLDADGKLLVREKDGVVNAGLGYRDTKVHETIKLPADEHFFGFGAYNNPLDMRGRSMVCSATELQTHALEGGFPVPFFLSSKGYGLFFNNLSDDATFQMGSTVKDEYSFSATSGAKEGWDMDYYLILGPRFEQILNRYTDLVGKPVLPEKWSFGHMQSICIGDKFKGTAEDYVAFAQKYRAGNWPCDVLIVDTYTVVGLARDFTWDPSFQNPEKMYDALDRLRFKTGISTALFAPQYHWGTYDPTVPEAVSHYWSKHVPIVKLGMDFWRQDNSESSERHTGKRRLANGYPIHNLFGSLWAKNEFEGMERAGLPGRPVISRGGPVGGHRYIIPWPGDLPHGIDYIGEDLNYVRNGGLVGYACITVDSGGYIKRNASQDPLDEQNVVRRALNLVPLMPISRAHGINEDGALMPWLLTREQQDLYRFYLNFRYRLHPYLYSCAIDARLTGRPILAPLVFDYPDDPQTYDKDFHFMLGRQLLVAPVVKPAVDQWEVYLPAGRWIHYWTGQSFEGGRTVKVEAPLKGRDGLPLFVKAGAIIPMMPAMQYIYEKAPDPLSLDVYPLSAGASGYVLKDCERPGGAITETKFACTAAEDGVTLELGASEVAYELWVHQDKPPQAVAVDGKALPMLESLAAFAAAGEGWYHGAGCFYGSETLKTTNIKLGKSNRVRTIAIK